MLGKIHFYFGIVVVIIFVLTGQYMHHNYNHLRDMEAMSRALFRAGHLYILLFGLINASLGIHFQISSNGLVKKIQLFGSFIIFIATFLIIYSFFTELPTDQIERPVSRVSLYLILFGVSVHGLVSLIKKDR